jgi:hypothetical protein
VTCRFPELKCGQQGDQIGRIFARWPIVGIVFRKYITEVAKIVGLFWSVNIGISVNFRKNGLGDILGDFLQTHLVTLLSTSHD